MRREGNDNASQSLLDLIINTGRFTESDARPLAQQVARTLSLLHSHGIVHRNLKVENVHIHIDIDPTGASGGPRAILTNFTFAGVTAPDPVTSARQFMARCGEQYSPAPELFDTQVPYVGSPVDVWGLGVVLYTLVCGRVPFDGPTPDVLHELSLRSPASLRFPKRVSRDCRDLLRRMLQADPVVRASLDEVLDHPWMKKPAFWHRRNVLKHATIRWSDQVDRMTFYRLAALEFRNGDDAWRSLTDALEQVSRLCEGHSGGNSRIGYLRLTTSHLSRLFRGMRGVRDLAWSLLAEVRSHPVPPRESAEQAPKLQAFKLQVPNSEANAI